MRRRHEVPAHRPMHAQTTQNCPVDRAEPPNHGADRAEVARRHYRHACATKPRSIQRLRSPPRQPSSLAAPLAQRPIRPYTPLTERKRQ